MSETTTKHTKDGVRLIAIERRRQGRGGREGLAPRSRA
jgi:hypothetical protein